MNPDGGKSPLAEVRRQLHERLLSSFDFNSAERMDRATLVADCTKRIGQALDRSGHSVTDADREWLLKGVLADMFGLGPLEPLLADPDLTDILVVRPDRIFVERHGRIEPATVFFRDAAHLLHVIHRLVRNAGRRIDERSPMVDARLPDGSRVNAVIPPLAVDGPQLSIRRFPESALTLDRMVAMGTLPAATAELLRSAVRGRLNIILSGGAGVGKTTLLNAISISLDSKERVITIEDAAELRLQGDHVVRLETRAANVEGVGEVTTRDLLRNALRMRPDRIIVGECRGAEAFDMLQAMNTGHEGSMTTLHANSGRDTITRLESMLTMGGLDMPLRVIRDYVASAIQLVVHLSRLPDGRRVVSEVLEIRGCGDDGIHVEVLHRFRLRTVEAGKVIGDFEATGVLPRFLPTLESKGCSPGASVFTAGPLPGATA